MNAMVGFHDLLGRLDGFAVIDILGTVLAAYFTAPYMGISFPLALLIWFILGEALHVMLGISTPFTRLFL
jgi:hypothetical protein